MFSIAPGTVPLSSPQRRMQPVFSEEDRTSRSFSRYPLTPPGLESPISTPPCMNPTDSLVEVRASEGLARMGKGTCLPQPSKSETARGQQVRAPLPARRGLKETGPEKSMSMDQNSRLGLKSCTAIPVTSSPWATVSPAASLPPPPTAVFLTGGRGEQRQLTQKQ